jgi:hypothetical protein
MASLVSTDDFAAFLGIDPTALNTARAELLLELASGLVRDELGQTLDYVADDDVTLIGPGGQVLLLPQLPVWEVTLVTETRFGNTRDLSIDVHYRLELGVDGLNAIIRRVPLVTRWPWREAVRVVYTHGYDTEDSTGVSAPPLPETLKAIILRTATRGYANPTGLRQETIGRYSYTNGQSGEAGMYLTAGDKAELGLFFPGQRAGARP